MQAKKHCLLLFVSLQMASLSLLWSQGSKDYTHNSLAEKIYLQVDSDVYTTNQTIWFKAILLNAVSHQPKYASGVLYVDLINANKKIVTSKLIKIEEGIGNGQFDLDRNYKEGKYLIRAYTEWNKNFETDFVFKKYVQIQSDTGTFKQPIQNIRRIDSTPTTSRFRASLYPQLIDATHQNELEVFISEAGVPKDTIVLNQSADSSYVLEYEALKSSNAIDFEFKTNSGEFYKTRFSPQLNFVDLQFFPEGGSLVEGLSSRVGFKALGTDGKGLSIKGEILNDKDELITTFEGNELGMGSFTLDNAKGLSHYKARFVLDEYQDYHEVDLPLVKPSGYVVSVKQRDDIVFVGVKSSTRSNKSIHLKGTSRGYVYFNQKAILLNGSYIYVIPKSSFPDGIVEFTLLNENKQPLAERLFFNEQPQGRLVLNASLDKRTYNQREKIELSIASKTVNNESIPANISLLTVNKNIVGDTYTLRESILSYFLLNSDLRGEIEQPGYYFKPGNSSEIDHLMLTQGWRNYKYKSPPQKMNFKREKGLSVEGVVTSKNNKIEKEDLELMLMTFDKEKSIYATSSPVPGSFSFDLEDVYGDDIGVTIQSLKNTKKEQNQLMFSIKEKKELPVTFDFQGRASVSDSITKRITEAYKIQKSKEDDYNFKINGTTELDEVVVIGSKMTLKQKEVYERYGKSEIVIEGDEIREKAPDWNWGLYSALDGFFANKIKITRSPNGEMYASVIGEITLFIVDGFPVLPEFYDQLQYISIEEVTSFEVLRTAKNFSKLFIRVNGPTPMPPHYGAIVSIYTRRGIGIAGALKDLGDNIDLHQIKVFSVEKEFYAPKYDATSVYDNSKPDLRLPVYWKPQIKTDQTGEISFNYYHSDDIGTFQIILEGVSKTGQLGYYTLDYSVEE